MKNWKDRVRGSSVKNYLLLIIIFSALLISILVFVNFLSFYRIKSSLEVREKERLSSSFPILIDSCEKNISNMLNSFGYWDQMIKEVKERDVPWIKEMFEDDEMVMSQFDSFGVYDRKGKMLYVYNDILEQKDIDNIVHFISSHFKKGEVAYPKFFFKRYGKDYYHIGFIPISDNKGKMADVGFIYFAHKVTEKVLKNFSKVLATEIKAQPFKDKHSLFAYPMKYLNGNTSGYFLFYPDASFLMIFSDVKGMFFLISALFVFLIAVFASILFLKFDSYVHDNLNFVEEYLNRVLNGDISRISNDINNRGDAISKVISKICTIGDKLKKNLIYDSLTEAYNRLYFTKKFEEETKRADRTGEKLTFVLIDLDDFKKINDTFGHVVGDEVLKSFSKAVKNVIRDIDIFGRLGGEEFGILLFGTDIEGAKKVIDRLRKKVKESPLVYNGKIISYTFSCGITDYRSGDTVDTMFQRADDALYKVKRTGKDGYSVDEEKEV